VNGKLSEMVSVFSRQGAGKSCHLITHAECILMSKLIIAKLMAQLVKLIRMLPVSTVPCSFK